MAEDPAPRRKAGEAPSDDTPAAALADADPLELLRARAGIGDATLDETLQWARARAEQILAGLSPDFELLGLLREHDRPLPDAKTRRATRRGIPVLLDGLPKPPAAPHRRETAAMFAITAEVRDDPPPAAAPVTPAPELLDGQGPSVTLDVPPRSRNPPDPLRRDVTREVGAIGSSPLARFLPEGSPPTPAEATPPPPESRSSPAQRKHPRYDLHQPVRIRHDRWDQFVEMSANDISRGGMFVATQTPPPLRESVAVIVELPAGAGTLTLTGEVVHVVTAAQASQGGQPAGFGLQFADLTPQRRAMLEQLLDHARRQDAARDREGLTLGQLGLASSATGTQLRLTLTDAEQRQLRELKGELVSMRARGDHELLGLSEASDLLDVRTAFEDLATKWRAVAAATDTLPEIRNLAREIYGLLEGAYERAVQRARVRSEDVRPTVESQAAGTAEPDPPPVAPTPAPSPPSTSADAAPPARAKGFVRRLLERSGKLTDRLVAPPSPSPSSPEAQEPAAATPRGRVAFNKLIGDGFEHLSAKRYGEAIVAFSLAVDWRPESTKAKILLLFAEARQLVKDKKLDEARAKYEMVLEIDPTNATAQRDLVMLSCLL